MNLEPHISFRNINRIGKPVLVSEVEKYVNIELHNYLTDGSKVLGMKKPCSKDEQDEFKSRMTCFEDILNMNLSGMYSLIKKTDHVKIRINQCEGKECKSKEEVRDFL
jgi:hypothetical protein